MSKIKKEPGMVIKEVSETKKKTPLKSAKEVAVQRADNIQAPVVSEKLDLITIAVQKGMGLEYIEKLIDLKNQEEDRKLAEEQRQAELQFSHDFAEMQKEFTPVKRTKENKKYSSSYATIDEMQRQYGPILSDHGFAYEWEDTNLEDGSMKVVFCLKKYGHVKRSALVLPPYTPDTGSSGKAIMNPMQAIGTVVSYGHRYTMKAGLGVTETDDDNDGNMEFQDGIDYAEEINQIRSCQNKEQLDVVYQTLSQNFREAKDKKGFSIISTECRKMEEKLRG